MDVQHGIERMQSEDPFIADVIDCRYSSEFYRRLQKYMGGPPEAQPPAFRPFYSAWWRDHAGVRSEFFRENLVPALERTRPIRGLTILDFGCGTGSSTVVLAERGATVVGLEPDQVSLDLAEQRVLDLGFSDRVTLTKIPYLVGDGEKLRLPDQSFDLATVIGVLEHTLPHERRHCAAELARVIKPGGEVFLYDTPNRLFPYDHHTTKLWFVTWLPSRVARAYAVWRGRMDRMADFQRRGGVGISRRDIDALFPPSRWELVQEKSASEVFLELKWAATQVPGTLQTFLAAGFVLGAIWPVIWASRLVNLRPSAWAANHVLTYRRRD
jgi:SAM-dependent methyltransferase